jgi:glycosyltransferase involved in cell wall biosynthesis
VKIAVFLNGLGLGGTEKAACRWARGLKQRGHNVNVLTLEDGPRRNELEEAGIVGVFVVQPKPDSIADLLRKLSPEIIHAHVPGRPHKGDILGEALALVPKISVLSTNVFGRFENPRENQWTDFRLFISWTSCVQAARRSFQRLDLDFFRRASVASYPLEPDDGPAREEISAFRQKHGIASDDIVFGRLSRPEPNKWTDLALIAFRIAVKRCPRIKLLLREPPAPVARQINSAEDRNRFVILPATADPRELRLTVGSIDVALHTSIIGESFGYGIAEPMNYAKPVIANSTPWQDQAQIELVRHSENGFISSTPSSIATRMCDLATNPALRFELGLNAQSHIRKLADEAKSLDRLERAMRATIDGAENPLAIEDCAHARAAAEYLDQHQFGHSWREQFALRPLYYRVRFHEFRRRLARKWRKE